MTTYLENPVPAYAEQGWLVPRVYFETVVVKVDLTAPVVSNVVPAPPGPIAVQGTVSLDVTDESGSLRLVRLDAEFSDGAYEVVYDGTRFSLGYASSSISVIAKGFHFDLRRRLGWYGAPKITPTAVDTSGNENV